MANILLNYMSKRLSEEDELSKRTSYGPVITVSREYGCYACKIAERLAEELNTKHSPSSGSPLWRIVTKEILEKAADELNKKPESISHVFGAEEKSFFGDILDSFSSKHYSSDSTIRRTISKVVRNFADEGHSIIVGRASCVIAKDIPNSLHIRLMAPFNWRVNQIQERFKITTAEAKNKVNEMDLKRNEFMNNFRGNLSENELFDVIFNRASLQENEIVGMTMKLLENKKFFL
jgi:cytidylate kinase